LKAHLGTPSLLLVLLLFSTQRMLVALVWQKKTRPLQLLLLLLFLLKVLIQALSGISYSTFIL
jgi:hypothetical protein